MRELLSGQGIPVPRHRVFPLDGDPREFANQVDYPCVMKPLILSASCGVIRANDEEEFRGAFRRVGTLLTNLGLVARDEQARWILVEDFVPGIEVALRVCSQRERFSPWRCSINLILSTAPSLKRRST